MDHRQPIEEAALHRTDKDNTGARALVDAQQYQPATDGVV